jgi:FMN hydrolase / 5-amino-6-(5-phospho-D-ribitylamino)uracil phosphatase
MPGAWRAICLDLDNTLWDVEPVLERAEAVLEDWFAAHYPGIGYSTATGREARREIVARHPERSHDLSWLRRTALRRLAARQQDPEGVADAAFAVFIGARHALVPYPEVPRALEQLAARYPLYALTNGNADVSKLPIGAHFTGAVGAAEAGAAKPDPRIFRYLLARAGLAAIEVLHVGDDPAADVAGARAAGLATAWLNRRGAPWPAALARADHEIADLGELVELVDRPGRLRP